MILWWNHCTKKQVKESAGSGRYMEPENEESVYAGTQLYKENPETDTLDEIRKYINLKRERVLVWQ